MGTEVQTKMHLYHCTRDLNDNASGGGGGGDWPLYHKSKALKNGLYHNLFSTKPSSDACLGHDKETLRQTILKHESVFRHQLHELHRLYKKQMDLMNGVKTSKLHNPWHASGVPETMDCELLESKCKKPKKVLIDLELPADEYISSEEEQLHVSAKSRLRSDCHADPSKSKPCLRRTNGLTNLNEPVRFGKKSTSASVDFPIQTNITSCSKEDTQELNLSANLHSAFRFFGKELPNFHRKRDEVISSLHLQNDKNETECSPYPSEHGRTTSYRNNLQGRACPEYGRTFHSSILQNAVTYEHRNKRTVFGVDFSDRDQNASVVASRSNFANSEPFFVSTQSRRSSAVSHLSMAKGHHWSNASTGFGCRNGTNDSNSVYGAFAKSTKYVSADVVSPNRYRNEVLSQQHLKHENRQGGSCWLRDMMLHKSEASKEKKDCSDLGLFQIGQRKSLFRCISQDQGCEVGKNKVVGDCSNNGMILGNSVKLELFEIDDSQSGEQPKAAKSHGLNKGLVDHNTKFRYHIDLNRCMTEEVEEAQLPPSSPKIDVNISAEIDSATLEGESPESTVKGPHEGHIRDAAEALVAISSSQAHDLKDNVPCNRSEASSCNSLVWFAEIVDNIDSDQEEDHDETDYFELMTLGLTETKVEEYSFEPQDREESKDENVSTRRPRKRKDFQRDVLPGLVTLSRYEVKEDLQIIEGLVGASGGTWQASLTRRRRNLGSSATSPKATSAAQIEQPKTQSLVSWGKRTRRLRRQRCADLISNHNVQVRE